MIDKDRQIIYVDYTTLAVFKSCRRKCQLGHVIGYRTSGHDAAIDFGHAWHAAMEAYYDSQAGGFHYHEDNENELGKFRTRKWQLFPSGTVINPVKQAQAAFLDDLKINEAQLQTTLEGPERRSVERGLFMIEAYTDRYRNELYENILWPSGEPMTELGFTFQIARYENFDIVMCGFIDRLMRAVMTKRPVLFETKSTIFALSQFIKQVKPNDQITTYFKHIQNIMPEIREAIWDCIFVSSRQPDMSKALKDRYWMWGIDKDKDFVRQPTSRSRSDIAEYMIETEEWALEYAKHLMSGKQWWNKTPSMMTCHFGKGCRFVDACNLNDQARSNFLEGRFIKKPWEPFKMIPGTGWWQE
jgi:hypothetical protein